MNMLDKCLDGVTDNPTINSGLTRLLHNIAIEIRGAAGNEAATLQLADMIDREAGRCAGHVLANTPMVMATPQVHPEPDTAGGQPDKLDVSSMTGTPDEIAAWQRDSGAREIERVSNDDGSFTAYFLPKKEATPAKPTA
jgi:hypothetical protein